MRYIMRGDDTSDFVISSNECFEVIVGKLED